MGLDFQHVHRALGALLSVAKVGPAVRGPRLYRALRRVGVLERVPSEWDDAPILDSLPWGHRPFTAPPPEPPSALGGPWPQAPQIPGFYPPVLHLPHADRREHFALNAARYLGQIVNVSPGAALRARRGKRLAPLDDATFVRAFTDTSFGQFIRHDLEDDDRAAFGARLNVGEDLSRWATLDFSFCPTEHLLPGMHAAPTVALLERVGDGHYRAAAIRVGAEVLTPDAGNAWALARYFVLASASCRLIASTHPRLHFGVDAVNAITRTALPAGHVVRRLMEPHMAFTLGLHEAVIYHRRSPIHNSQREVYTPFPFRTEGMHALVGAGRDGVAGRRAWPAYRFDDGLFGEHVPYGRFRREWFDLIHDLTRAVTASVSPDDDAVRRWADHIAPWVPGFPTGVEVREAGVLARAVARFICTVSVYHTGDHHSYASLPLAMTPFRVRAALPDAAAADAPLDLDSLVSPEDFYRHALAYAMFYKPTIVRSLREVRYGFDDAPAREAVARAHAAMDALDARWKGSTFPASTEIGSSLQY